MFISDCLSRTLKGARQYTNPPLEELLGTGRWPGKIENVQEPFEGGQLLLQIWLAELAPLGPGELWVREGCLFGQVWGQELMGSLIVCIRVVHCGERENLSCN